MVATMIAMAFEVVGFDSSTPSLSMYHTPLSTTKVVPPTMPNLSSSRCLISTERSGSGVCESTFSATVTDAVYVVNDSRGKSGGALFRIRGLFGVGGADDPWTGARLGEHPFLEGPPAEHHRQQGAQNHSADVVGDLLGHY